MTEVTGSPFESYARTSTTLPLSQVKLLVPVIPPTFYAAGVNYREHVTEMAQRRGVKPEFPPQRRRRLPRQQRADRHRRADRHPQGRDGARSSTRASWSR